MSAGHVSVLVAAAGAGWEALAVRHLGSGGPGIVLLKRCVDLGDLLATATTGQGRVAVVAHGLPGLDADSVGLLRRAGLGVVLVAEPSDLEGGGEDRVRRLGIEHVLESVSLDSLNETVAASALGPPSAEPSHGPGSQEVAPPDQPGRLLTVWGPAGAPGRTTLAVGVAAELAHRGHSSFLLDVDGFGGAVAQHLGVLDEMSGLLAAARMANAGQLDHARLTTLARTVHPSLRVLTGLPRADRWPEVREGAFEQLLELARGMAEYAVLDTAFSLEEDVNAAFAGGAPQRNGMTLRSVEQADEIIVVGSADPVGLTRLARGMVELLEVVPGATLRVVVNRTRPSLGWGEKQVRAMVEGFVTPQSMHFLPDDRATADRAQVSGKSLVELGDSPLRRAVAGLADAVIGQTRSSVTPGRRFSREGRAQALNRR